MEYFIFLMEQCKDINGKTILRCQKRLQRIRFCIYILILITIARIAMSDFNGISVRICIDVAFMLLFIGFALILENSTRKKLKKAIRRSDETEEPY